MHNSEHSHFSAEKKIQEIKTRTSAEQYHGIPHSVAAPCRLEDMAMVIMLFTGEISSFLQIVIATGATISTVATLSTNAEIRPANSAKDMIAQRTFGIFFIIKSASKEGILDAIKSDTIPIVPPIIISTFQSIENKNLCIGNIPAATKIIADTNAIYAR